VSALQVDAGGAAGAAVTPVATVLPAAPAGVNTPWGPTLQAVARREWLTAVRRPGDLAWHAGFFVMVAALFPLSLRPDPASLLLLGPGVLWVAALLAVLLATGRLFHDDLKSGWLDQCVLAAGAAAVPLALLVAARMAVQWLLAAGPVLLVAPLVALQFGLNLAALGVLMAGLALGTAVLVALASVAAALAAGLRGAALLTMLMVLPMAAPVLVFGALAVHAAQGGASAAAELSLLGAMLAAAALVCPVLGALALRSATES
jgi:heme exporter protein B